MIDFHTKFHDAHMKSTPVPVFKLRIMMNEFARFRHLTRKQQDEFILCLDDYPHFKTLALELQQEDELRGWQN